MAQRTFDTDDFGTALISTHRYQKTDGLAVQLITHNEDGYEELLATLSVCFPDADPLPPNCFYVKDWSENELVIHDAAASGWFKPRLDLGGVTSGHVCALAWELLDARGEPFEWDGI